MEESELVNKCASGDKRAFAELMHLYRRRLYSYILRSAGSQNAEDILQETLIKVWKAFPGYNEKQKFSSWLFTIAHNAVVDSLRKSKASPDMENYSESLVGGKNEALAVENYETGEALKKAVENLPQKQKEVLLLRIYSGMKYREIAENMSMPLNSVISCMNYAVQKLKKELGALNER